MASESKYEQSLPKYQKLNAFKGAMYWYCKGLQDTVTHMPDVQAVELFLSRENISEDDYSLQSAVRTYQNLKKEMSKNMFT